MVACLLWNTERKPVKMFEVKRKKMSQSFPPPSTPTKVSRSPPKPFVSPSKSGQKPSSCDRFIQDRGTAGGDLSAAFMLHTAGGEMFGSPSKHTKRNKSGETDVARDEANRLYSKVLRNELFPDTSLPRTNSTDVPSGLIGDKSGFLQGNSAAGRLLNLHVPLTEKLRAARRLDFGQALDAPTHEKYSISPVRTSSQLVLQSPRKPPRYISKVPFKVLDAPDLADDFYLNLVDWGSSNVLGVGLGSCVYLWSACTSRVTKLCDIGPYDSVTSVNWIQRGSHIAVGTNHGTVQIWDVGKCKKIRTMTGHTARVGTLAWNDYILTSGSRDRSILHRDVRCQEHHIKKLCGHKQEVCGLKWNGESQLASGGNDNRLIIWDKMNETPTFKFSEHTAAVKAISWSPHQNGLLASGGGTADRRIRFWNTLTGSPLQCIDTGSQVCNLANEIVSTHGYSQNQVIVWKYPSMQQLATLTGHTFRVLYLAISPDGQTIVTGAGDETLRFWNVFTKPRERNEGISILAPSPRSIR